MTLEEKYRQAAIDLHYDEGVLEIDDDAPVSLTDDETGAYVQAWIWIDDGAFTP